ncbi:MAG: hypothetical protein IPO40_12520 [Fibrobacteres bacterium]|nr:hypothetical protein [Fibrobacterota bacterium]
MKPWPFFLSVLVASGFLGCSEDRSAGTSTETENAIGARLLRVDSVLSPNEGFPGEPAVATIRLNSTQLDFSKSRPDGRDLEVIRMDGKAIPFEVDFWDTKQSVGRLHVRIEPAQRFHGSYFWVRWGLPAAVRESSTDVWAGIPDYRRLAWNSVVVDDFESGTYNRTKLPDSSFWFMGGFVPASGLTAAGLGRNGNSLHLVCATGQCDSGRILLTATMIATTRRSLRGLDSVELWARGTGKIWVTFESLDSVQMGRMSRGKIDSIVPRRAWAPAPLASSWQRIVVRPSDFAQPDGIAGNVGWSSIRDSINYLSLVIEGGSEMWVDDIRFHGVVRQDLQ